MAIAAARQPVQTANLPAECQYYLLVESPKELEKTVQLVQRFPDDEWTALQTQRKQQWYDDMFLEHVMPLSHAIWPEWTESDTKSWPAELQYFWYGIHWKDEPKKVAAAIRKYYAEDEKLLALADWLEYWNSKGLKISLERRPYEYAVIKSEPPVPAPLAAWHFFVEYPFFLFLLSVIVVEVICFIILYK
jgi:hypothetical protein